MFQTMKAEDVTIGAILAHIDAPLTHDIWNFHTSQSTISCKRNFLVNHKVIFLYLFIY